MSASGFPYYKKNSSDMAEKPRDACFSTGVVTLRLNFRRKKPSPTNYCWCQQTRVIPLSCGIKIFAVHCLVLSHSTRVSNGQTDGQRAGASNPPLWMGDKLPTSDTYGEAQFTLFEPNTEARFYSLALRDLYSLL